MEALAVQLEPAETTTLLHRTTGGWLKGTHCTTAADALLTEIAEVDSPSKLWPQTPLDSSTSAVTVTVLVKEANDPLVQLRNTVQSVKILVALAAREKGAGMLHPEADRVGSSIMQLDRATLPAATCMR